MKERKKENWEYDREKDDLKKREKEHEQLLRKRMTDVRKF